MIYPFYISAESTTRKSPIQGGMRAKDGHMTTEVYQRNKGDIETPYTIQQVTWEDLEGNLKLETRIFHFGEIVHRYITDY